MIIHTLTTRPYIFIFLIVFLIISSRTRGWTRTLIFLISGYLIAWASEALSIRYGIPYGWYFYIYENLQGELLNFGVPVWDSLSYVFLCFAGLSLAEYVLYEKKSVSLRGAERRSNPDVSSGSPRRPHGLLAMTFYSALFVTILDIVIDPLAHLGDQWFLGKIYYYPEPGFYFDVPLSNFAGWFGVSFVIIGINKLISPYLPLTKSPPHQVSPSPSRIWSLSGPLLYFSIFLFNWIITLWIHQWVLSLVDLLWISIPGYLFVRRVRGTS